MLSAIAQKRAEVNNAIGDKLRRLRSQIVGIPRCSINKEMQEQLHSQFQLPAEIFYPDAALDEMDMGSEEEVLN